MITKTVLPFRWRSLRYGDLINLRRELRLLSKELEERNALREAASVHSALAKLDLHLDGVLVQPLANYVQAIAA